MGKLKGAIIWITGFSGSGKSTLATKLEKVLIERGNSVQVLDGDVVRKGLSSDLGYSSEDRKENIRRIGEVAKLFCDASFISIVAIVSPFKKDREKARELVKLGQFVEIYLDCPLEVCEIRDTKGLYKKARNNEIENVPGIDLPYEPPFQPEIKLRTDQDTVEQDIQKILTYLRENKIL